jgi:hypothetical protein
LSRTPGAHRHQIHTTLKKTVVQLNVARGCDAAGREAIARAKGVWPSLNGCLADGGGGGGGGTSPAAAAAAELLALLASEQPSAAALLKAAAAAASSPDDGSASGGGGVPWHTYAAIVAGAGTSHSMVCSLARLVACLVREVRAMGERGGRVYI